MNTVNLGVAVRHEMTAGGLVIADKKQQSEIILTQVRVAILRKFGFTRFRGVELKDAAVEITVADSRFPMKSSKPLDTETLAEYATRVKPEAMLYMNKLAKILNLPNYIEQGTDVLLGYTEPVAEAPDNDMITVMVPLRLLTGFATLVVPIAAPVVGIIPEPAVMPLMVIDQFCAPVALLWHQKSKLAIFKLYPAATLNVSVMEGLPPELAIAIASPALPA